VRQKHVATQYMKDKNKYCIFKSAQRDSNTMTDQSQKRVEHLKNDMLQVMHNNFIITEG
jgi:hypothetical protein